MAGIIDVWHHQVESEWMSVFFFFVRNGWIQDGSIQDDCHHKVGSEWMSEVFFLFKMAESKMADFKMADIIKLGKNEWVWVRLNWFESEWEWHESVFEWISEKITRCLNSRWQWLNPQWQNSRWLQSSSWFRMYEWSVFVQNSWIQDGRIQDGCHYKVESE